MPKPPGDGVEPDITRLLSEIVAKGDVRSREELLRTVYEELRVIAESHMRRERAGHTLGATGLINEAYIRLLGRNEPSEAGGFPHRHAFFKAAATAMRRILIDHARERHAAKRGGHRQRGIISADLLEASAEADPADLLALDEALAALDREDERAALVVHLRFYAGRTIQEVADMLRIDPRTVKRDWEYARARLQQLLDETAISPSNE